MALRALWITLDDNRSWQEELPPEVEQHFLGGRGAATWLLGTRLGPDTGPLSPANLLIFSAGPLAGMLSIASGTFVVSTRSPLTGTIGHSWALGRWGGALRRAGHDLLVLKGKSPEWCYIQIDGETVQIHPAGSLMGLDTVATAREIQNTLGEEYSVVCVGPAGETGVAYSSIIADGIFAAEPAGTGAVMAGKRVKAIAVRGMARLAPADERRVDAVVAGINRRASTSELAAGIRQYGSMFFAVRAEERGAFTGRNGQDASVSHLAAISRSVLAQRGKREGRGCEGCPLPCYSTYMRKSGEPLAYPELEALAGFGARCGISTPDALIVVNDVCIRLGLDVVETSAALAFMMECQQQGLSSARTLTWGDGEAILAALKRLAQPQEKRDVLSLGVGEMQEIYYGSTDFAPQVKGMALPGLDLRALPEFALACAVSPIGGDYRYAMDYETLLSEPPAWLPDDPNNPLSIRGKVPRLIWHERFAAALDSAGLCRKLALMAYQVAPAEVTELLSAALGRSFTGVEVARIGERIVTFERLITRRFDPQKDTLPRRWTKVALPEGPAAGQILPLDEMLAEYYRRHGWDEQGDPPPARLAELNIPDLEE